jgi:integrase/recombinase XerD
MIQAIQQQKTAYAQNENPLLKKDSWEASELGLEPSRGHGSYYLNFDLLTIGWLKTATKRFILLQSATRSYNTCKGYIDSVTRLVNYINENNITLNPEDLRRDLIVGFLNYLSVKKYSVSTRILTLSNIRTLHNAIITENWYPCSLRPIVHDTDFPRKTNASPRYIPDFV